MPWREPATQPVPDRLSTSGTFTNQAFTNQAFTSGASANGSFANRSLSVGKLPARLNFDMLRDWSNGLLRLYPIEDYLLNKDVDMAAINSDAQGTRPSDLPLYVQRITHPATQPIPHAPHLSRAHSDGSLPLFEQRRRLPRPEVPATLSIAITNRAPHQLSRTTLTVIDLLLTGDLLRLRSEEVADTLHISPTTLRRRLRVDGTHYQSILDHIRRHRCTLQLEKRWLPGKCVAWDLGYAEVNSFYRAFRRWTGHNYSDLKRLYL